MTGQPASHHAALLPDVLPEDRLLWQFWVNKGMEAAPLRECLAVLGERGAPVNWDYMAGNAMYGGFEEALLRELKAASAAGGGVGAGARGVPAEFLDRLARDVAGSRHPVTAGTPEGRLLVLCASPRMTPAEEEEARALAQGRIEWEALAQAAARANVTVAVQHNLSRLELDRTMPAALASVLSARTRGIASRNRRLLGLLDELGAVLRAEGMRVLLLKESALALSHYGNGRLRMMGDIDLLLGPGEVDRAVAMLEARGYQSAEVLWTKAHYRGRHHHAAPLVRGDLAVKIEPHRGIALPELPRGTPDRLVEEMAARAVRIDANTWCFSPADTLFHLCLDLYSNAFIGKMGQLCDAREVVRQGGVEWQRVEDLGSAAAAEAHLVFSLRLLADLDAPVPAEVIARLQAARAPAFEGRRLRRMARRNLFGHVRSRARLSRAGETLVFLALMRPGGWAGRAAFLMKRYLYLGARDEELGDLARRVRPTTGQALGRMLTLPLRALRRWTASRRVP